MVSERRMHVKQALLEKLCLPTPSMAAAYPSSPQLFSLSDLEKLSVLGHGSGGTVYLVRHLPTSSLFALKVLHSNSNSSTNHEADVLARVEDCPHVVRCHGVLDVAGLCCLVLEYMPGGSLLDVLRARGRLSEELIAWVAKCVLRALLHLHAAGVVHGDVKPSNLLISRQGEVKIADFGASRLATSEEAACEEGTRAYMSPERLDSEGFQGDAGGFAGDVWALGVVLLECLVGRLPLAGPGITWAVCLGGGPQLQVPEGEASPELRSFVGRCLEREWRRRATAAELLAHPFVAKCGDCATAAWTQKLI
ncbi:Mitogen-activated protein kinase kinase 10 [Ananas comosus]|uniref:mitogen-activated protein kinase kinase n=1 Tax=Ananas comosus TaxID=4615 RepID=A0A199V064_ANACO|nr:Mitogen-activated protein kinase kinase 10 [Ananas comosus]